MNSRQRRKHGRAIARLLDYLDLTATAKHTQFCVLDRRVYLSRGRDKQAVITAVKKWNKKDSVKIDH